MSDFGHVVDILALELWREIATFTSVSTFASIIQQIHYAVHWRNIKQLQYERALENLRHPARAFGGAAGGLDDALFYIQFYTYNVMSLNILFWATLLFVGSWNIKATWLGNWRYKLAPASKIFSVIYPTFTVGLMQSDIIADNIPGFFVVANSTKVILGSLIGAILMFLTLFKYIKTRRLVLQSGGRGGWWASGGSKERRAPALNTEESQIGVTTSDGTRDALYDRSLIIRFCIGFTIMTFFVVAVVFFNFFHLAMKASLALSGGPNLEPSSAITDLAFFAPGVTASLVTFLVFGTTKSWRQYRDLVFSGCGIMTAIKHKRSRQAAENSQKEQSLEFARLPSLPSLTRKLSDEERARGKEIESRVRMFSIDSGSVSPIEHPSYSTPVHRPGPSYSSIGTQTFSSVGTQTFSSVGTQRRDSHATAQPIQFHRVFPSYDSGSGIEIEAGRGDLVIQYDPRETIGRDYSSRVQVLPGGRLTEERPTQDFYGRAL
ncbi:hypothetical protein HYALB_00001167 [Hymenoscyphus albidus]|uniref:Uncharacterized protein n=1 Tax=Hymenoscyphus albidus TaxID=595503 RepID=A0A9N9LGV9_9HELO|nr:hypothetical protein HYALB_00001167 [Hymenoscyphus albidus]